MNAKNIVFGVAGFALSLASLVAQPMDKLIDTTLSTCAEHARNMLVELESKPDVMPRTFENGKLVTSKVSWWCSGFFPGTLWYLYEARGDESFKTAAKKYTGMIGGLLTQRTDHDIGFQFYCSYGNGYRLTGDKQYKGILISAAEKLCSRFDKTTQCIRSWDGDNKGKWQYPVIIDNMMNLELLEFAAKNSDNPDFSYVATSHADTTMKNHFRDDYSCVHVVSYDRKSGVPHLKQTWQGLADDSSWSRGQAWALYGYTMMARETGDARYLKQAENVAKFLMNHKNMPSDKIPYWDFDAPASDKTLRDASAGAIIASALTELSTLTKNTELAKQCRSVAETQLRALSSEKYLAPVGTNGNFILKHSVGAIPFKSEIDVPLTYADYYFVEALLRYKKICK